MPGFVIAEDVHRREELASGSILSRTLFQSDHTKTIQFVFAPGQELSAHTAPFPAILLLLEGEATVRLGEETRELGAGALVHMEAHLEHGIKAKSHLVLLLVLLKSAR